MRAIVDWLNTTAFTSFNAPTSWAEVLGFGAGILCVVLMARQSVWGWPVGIFNNVVWIVLFASAGLYADSGLQFIYIALALWGWWNWLHGGRNRGELPVSKIASTEWLGLIAAGAAGTGVLVFVLTTYTPSTVPFWDALTTALALMATWAQARKKLECWILWIIGDLVYIPLYFHKDLVLTALLYIGFLALGIGGYVMWRRSYRAQVAA